MVAILFAAVRYWWVTQDIRPQLHATKNMNQKTKQFRGSVLLIGSLYWENENNAVSKLQGQLRAKWRTSLELENKIEVAVPIRYGRKSGSRCSTYTMLFSISAKPGSAFLIPYKESVSSFKELQKQAVELALAESIANVKNPQRIFNDWAAVCIKTRQGIEGFADILAEWKREFKQFDSSNYKIDDEAPCVTAEGVLDFDFAIPQGIDYVLATPVVPNVTRYPSLDEVLITALRSKPQYSRYIIENILHGIRVNGDDEIHHFVEAVKNACSLNVAVSVAGKLTGVSGISLSSHEN